MRCHSPEALRFVDVVSRVRPIWIQQDAMIPLNEQLQFVYEPGIIVSNLGNPNLQSSPLGGALVVPVAPFPEQHVG